MAAFTFSDVFRRGGLRTTEAARLIGITRVSVSHYKNGRAPHSWLARRVERFTDAVHAAVQAGELPLHQDVRREDRLKQLSVILRKHLKAAE